MLNPRRGAMVYVPRTVMNEVQSIIVEDNIRIRSRAFEEMVKYSKVGREAKRIMSINIFRPNRDGWKKRGALRGGK